MMRRNLFRAKSRDAVNGRDQIPLRWPEKKGIGRLRIQSFLFFSFVVVVAFLLLHNGRLFNGSQKKTSTPPEANEE